MPIVLAAKKIDELAAVKNLHFYIEYEVLELSITPKFRLYAVLRMKWASIISITGSGLYLRKKPQNSDALDDWSIVQMWRLRTLHAAIRDTIKIKASV